MRKLVLILGIWVLGGVAYAQQHAQYTQYIFNGLIVNPAYAGSKDIWNVNAIYRDQWAGLEGSPTTQTFSTDGSIKQGKIGLGFQAINDEIGVDGQLSVLANAAVRLNVSETGKLRFGLAGGATQYTRDWTKVRTTDLNDPANPNVRVTAIAPTVKAGVYFHTERFYAGLSGANLVPVQNDFVITPTRHYFLTSGYVFDLGEQVKFKPSFLVKEDFKGPTNVDLNGFILFAERLWLGASYRTGVNLLRKPTTNQQLELSSAWAGIAEIYLTPKLKLGYAYDFTLNGLNDYASHEISIGFYFLKKEETFMLSPRYF